MEDHKILLTGDYWHQDFQHIVSGFGVPVTLVPIEKVETVSDSSFDLIVIAQSRRNQFFAEDVEQIQETFAGIPVVGLLGSWCEGETRSGSPWPGVIRVYWHQWEGQYERFAKQLAESGITQWHAPRTSTPADRIAARIPRTPDSRQIQYIGISAWTPTQHEMVADAVKTLGWKSRWVERFMWDGETTQMISAICVEADGWSASLQNRIKWLRNEIPNAPLVLLLNYPRKSQLEAIQMAGVSEVVSKPFELDDLKSAIVRAVENQTQSSLETSV
jgi:hypothetical protein